MAGKKTAHLRKYRPQGPLKSDTAAIPRQIVWLKSKAPPRIIRKVVARFDQDGWYGHHADAPIFMPYVWPSMAWDVIKSEIYDPDALDPEACSCKKFDTDFYGVSVKGLHHPQCPLYQPPRHSIGPPNKEPDENSE